MVSLRVCENSSVVFVVLVQRRFSSLNYCRMYARIGSLVGCEPIMCGINCCDAVILGIVTTATCLRMICTESYECGKRCDEGGQVTMAM